VGPHQTRLKPFDFTIYRIVKSDADATAYSLDVGGADDLHLLDFQPKERLGGRGLTFRWTKTRSQLLLGVKDSSRDLVLSPQQRVPVRPSSRALVRVGNHELRDGSLPVSSTTMCFASVWSGRRDSTETAR
jgi:hypothetical protein